MTRARSVYHVGDLPDTTGRWSDHRGRVGLPGGGEHKWWGLGLTATDVKTPGVGRIMDTFGCSYDTALRVRGVLLIGLDPRVSIVGEAPKVDHVHGANPVPFAGTPWTVEDRLDAVGAILECAPAGPGNERRAPRQITYCGIERLYPEERREGGSRGRGFLPRSVIYYLNTGDSYSPTLAFGWTLIGAFARIGYFKCFPGWAVAAGLDS